MRTVPLGDSGKNVSALCLGAMYFGTRNDKAESYGLLDAYLDAGGTFIDTANIYAHWIDGFKGGESETLLGEWMRARGNRDQLFLASKVGFEMPDVEIGLTARQIEDECNKSLRRLGVDTIDLYYAHVDDRHTPLEETMEAFDRLVQAGKVRLLGASNYLAWRLERARWVSEVNGWAKFVCVQQRHTYLRPKPGATFDPQIAANDDLLDYCANNPITLLAYSALLSGAYVRDDRPLPDQYLGPDADARLQALHAVAAAQDASANQVILAWMLAHDIIPLIAASRPEHLHENIAALDLHLSPDEVARLDQAMA